MGTTLSCPCQEKLQDKDQNPPKTVDILMEIMKEKITPDDVLYTFTHDNTKVYLIKGHQVDGFFANRSFIKLGKSNGDKNLYYNSIYLTNYMSRSDECLIFLQNTKKRNANHIYKISQVASAEKFELSFLENLTMMSNKGYKLLGVVSAGWGCNNTRNYKLIYTKSEREVTYDIYAYEEKNTFNEEKLKSILEKKKTKLLKSIVQVNKKFYFIFEEHLNSKDEFEYLILALDRRGHMFVDNDSYLQEITKKINTMQNHYHLNCMLSDENKFYLTLVDTYNIKSDVDDKMILNDNENDRQNTNTQVSQYDSPIEL